MWGADDPDCRKPMVWQELIYDDETTHPCDHLDCEGTRATDKVEVDSNLLHYYKSLTKLRRDFPSLSQGHYKTVYMYDKGLFIYSRELGDETILAAFNGSNVPETIPESVFNQFGADWTVIFGVEGKTLQPKSGKLFKKL